MARPGERLTADAYTRASVEAYLRAVSDERTRLELAIADQRRRHESARRLLERLDGITPLPSETEAEGTPAPMRLQTSPAPAARGE